jgi:hypothetical protein
MGLIFMNISVADPDFSFHFRIRLFSLDAVADPAFHSDADPASQTDADPCGFGSGTMMKNEYQRHQLQYQTEMPRRGVNVRQLGNQNINSKKK